jgi:hypothetical protein
LKIEIKEMSRASEGDTIEFEGKVFRANDPNSGQYGWSQFIVVKDATGEQGCWLNLEGEEDKVTKGSTIRIKGKVGKEYKNKQGKMDRSVNNCQFEVGEAPVQSSTQSSNGTKDNYWEKKFIWDQKVHFSIIRECAIKAVTELAKISSKTFLIKVHTEKDYFKFSDKIVDYICRKLKTEDIAEEPTKEEKIKKAREVVGETEFKPASTKQKRIIFGYKDKEGYHKGIIDSRYIETDEIKKIGDPKKLSVEKASEWIEFWWGEEGNPDDIGARKQREIDNPRDDNGAPVDALVKGDKTSVSKDIIVDEIYALRRENRLNDDNKFKKEIGYNPKIEELTEAECLKLKDLLKRYVPF